GLQRLTHSEKMSSATSHGPVRSDTVIVVNLAFVGAVAPSWFGADVVRWSAFQLPLLEIDNVTAQIGVIFENRPGQGMILVSDAEKAAEGHDRISVFSRRLIDHQIMNRPEVVAGGVIHVRSLNLVRRDEVACPCLASIAFSFISSLET